LCLSVTRIGDGTLEVRFREPIPPNHEAMRLELDLYLRVWEAMNPDARAAIVA
jgi:hypothetical protein